MVAYVQDHRINNVNHARGFAAGLNSSEADSHRGL
jgi:hypothetical protein